MFVKKIACGPSWEPRKEAGGGRDRVDRREHHRVPVHHEHLRGSHTDASLMPAADVGQIQVNVKTLCRAKNRNNKK